MEKYSKESYEKSIPLKGQLKNIYQKLNVNKRGEAVEKTKEIGIL